MPEFIVAAGHRLETACLYAERDDWPWLVFLHEGLGSIAQWRDFPQRLCAAADCRGLLYSRCGYGNSEVLGGPRAPDYLHQEALQTLPEVLQRFGIEQPFLLGHSDGASIALIYAAQHASAVAATIVLAPHVLVEPISIAGIEAAREAYLRTDLRARLARYHADPDSAFLGWNNIWLQPAFRNWNIEALLAAIRCPLLAIQGEQDQYGTMLQLQRIAAGATGSAVELCKLARCGHAPHTEQPEIVLAAVQAFIARVARRQAG